MSEAECSDRTCGGCTACCQILPFLEPDLQKPANVDCINCIPGVGCRIYETRYAMCRNFMCHWVTDGTVGPHWRPLQSHMVLATDRDTATLVVHVDSAFPTAWRAAPFITDLRSWAKSPTSLHQRVVVKVNDDFTVIFPEGEKFIGPMLPGQALLVHEIGTMFWKIYDAEVVDGSDPRAAGAIGRPQIINPDAIRLDLPPQGHGSS